MTPFEAKFSFAEDSDGIYKAGLADDQFETTRYVLFERTKEPTPQDIEFGFEAPHVEIDDQGCSGYSLVQSVVLENTKLRIQFNEKGRRVMPIESDRFDVVISGELELNVFAELMSMIFGPEQFLDQRKFDS